jgi:DNA-binding transcriptional LysR family regulator
VNLDDLRALLAVADTGSVLGAAEALRISRATLRRRIADLEVQAGAQLLQPTRLGASLTPAGVELVAHGRALLHEATIALAAAREASGAGLGVLQVAAPVGMPPLLMSALISEARGRLPGMRIHLRFYSDPYDCLREEVHLIFHFGARVPRGAWMTTVLMRMEEHLLAAPDYLAAHGTPQTVEDLARHTLLSWSPTDEDPERWPMTGGAALAVSPALVSPDVHLMRQCASQGMGIARVPDAALPADTEEFGELVPVLPALFCRSIACRALVPEGLAVLPQSRALMALVRSFLGES